MTPRPILITDDEETVALTPQAGLETLPDCEIAVATSGEQAVYQLREQTFDLLITDKMPGINGLELVARTRGLQPRIGLILSTACPSGDLYAQAEQASVQVILEKPVRLLDLRRAVLQALGCAFWDMTQHRFCARMAM